MNPHTQTKLSRRRLLQTGGALAVYFSLRDPLDALAQGAPPPKLPGSLDKFPLLDSWIKIDANGAITVFTGKAELGQGIKTAFIQLAAEELSVEPGDLTLVTADTGRTPNEGYTAGSHSMKDSGTAIQNAAAQVRGLLLDLAATRFNMPREQLKPQRGTVVAADGRVLRYAELVAGLDLHRPAVPGAPKADPKTYTVIGKPLPRVDIPAKVTGGLAYVQDMRPDGLVHARVVRPPNPAAKLKALDSQPVEQMPGVIKVVRDGSFLAVVAAGEFQAIQAMNALSSLAQWEGQANLPKQANISDVIRALPAQDTVILNQGSLGQASGRALKATYHRPYQMHGAIGPSCALAQFKDGTMTVWTHSQGVYPLRDSLAELLRMPKEQVHCIHTEGSGCYGHNGADDAAADAALIARAVPDRPVRVQWMREQEHGWEPYGPAMVTEVQAALDADGKIADWQYEVWSNTHSTRPGGAGNLLAALHLAQPFAQPAPTPIPQPEGGGDRNGIPLYAVPNARVTSHFIPAMPVRVSAMRGLGAYMNVFSIESFMDEMAALAGTDPVEFRLRHLEDTRARDVIALAAKEFGWKPNEPLPKGRGRGFAFARYKNLAGYAAIALDVEVERETGVVQIGRVVAAVDSGQVVNPDGIRNQIEGAIVQSASWTLYESVGYSEREITSRDWGSYPILRFPAMPSKIDVHIIDRPGQPFLGTGEAGQGPASAAIANAVASATGVRMRSLPLSPARVKAAIGI
ncbi:MAG: putative oxidoreductase subunit protein [Xanthobacteraceae bacterium]|nr:putative oxidoreductase subunit protein [Xanthobacteraceae bacterium]